MGRDVAKALTGGDGEGKRGNKEDAEST